MAVPRLAWSATVRPEAARHGRNQFGIHLIEQAVLEPAEPRFIHGVGRNHACPLRAAITRPHC